MLESNKLDLFFGEIYLSLIKSLEKASGGPFGAGIVIEGELISVGTNEVLRTLDVSRHAEIVALSKATEKVKSIQLPNAIILATHFPCLMCYQAIKIASIKQGYYIFDSIETNELFSFKRSSSFLADLDISSKTLDMDQSLSFSKYRSPRIEELFYNTFLNSWNTKFRNLLPQYYIC